MDDDEPQDEEHNNFQKKIGNADVVKLGIDQIIIKKFQNNEIILHSVLHCCQKLKKQ